MRKLLLVLLLALSPLLTAYGYEEDFKFWAVLQQTGENPNSPFRYLLQAQARFGDQHSLFEEGVLRLGLGWPERGAWSAWLGFEYHPLLSEDGHRWSNERRLWQQGLWEGQMFNKGVDASVQVRLEERKKGGDAQIALRSRQQVELIFNNMRLYDKFIPVLREEIFFNLNNTDWVSSHFFSQNRLFVGFNVDNKAPYTWQVGYLNQAIWNSSTQDQMNHILYVALLFK